MLHEYSVADCGAMATSPIPMQGSLHVKWDPKNLEIRTKSVERTLEPLVTQVRFCLDF